MTIDERHTRRLWEPLLADIDDGGFFGQELSTSADRARNPNLFPRRIGYASHQLVGMSRTPRHRPAVLFAPREEWMTYDDAPPATACGPGTWQALLGPDAGRAVLLSLLTVALAILALIIVIPLLLIIG